MSCTSLRPLWVKLQLHVVPAPASTPQTLSPLFTSQVLTLVNFIHINAPWWASSGCGFSELLIPDLSTCLRKVLSHSSCLKGQGHPTHDIFWALLDAEKTCLADCSQQLCSLLQFLWKYRFKMHYNTLYTIGPTPRGKKCCLENKTFLRTNMTALVGAHLVDAHWYMQ